MGTKPYTRIYTRASELDCHVLDKSKNHAIWVAAVFFFLIEFPLHLHIAEHQAAAFKRKIRLPASCLAACLAACVDSSSRKGSTAPVSFLTGGRYCAASCMCTARTVACIGCCLPGGVSLACLSENLLPGALSNHHHRIALLLHLRQQEQRQRKNIVRERERQR